MKRFNSTALIFHFTVRYEIVLQSFLNDFQNAYDCSESVQDSKIQDLRAFLLDRSIGIGAYGWGKG